jgi:acetyltransferase-like isoleucine patch superfamily enzyme
VTHRLERRRPAAFTGDGAAVARYYRAGSGARGRPRVLVHKGDRTRAVFGSRSVVHPDVEILIGGNHRIDWLTTFPLREVYDLPGAYEGNPWSKGDVQIGSNVVLGRGVRVLSGVRIGDGAVVLPYSVVTRDVSPGEVVGGQPAAPLGHQGGSGAGSPSAVPSSSTSRSTRNGAMQQKTKLVSRAGFGARSIAARTLRAVAGRLDGDPLPPFPFVVDPPEGPQKVVMGPASYFEPVLRADGNPNARVEIGAYATISYDTEFHFPPTFDRGAVAQSGRLRPPHSPSVRAVVGADTWITRGTRVVGEVTIGPGAVVAAYSVVRGDVRPYAIVAGNPAREVGRRFDDDTVEALLRIRWWDWPEEVVKDRYAELCSTDVRSFIDRYDPDRSESGRLPAGA